MTSGEVWFHRTLVGYWPVHWKGWASTLAAVVVVFALSYGALWMCRQLGQPGWAVWMVPVFVLPAFGAWFIQAVRHSSEKTRAQRGN